MEERRRNPRADLDFELLFASAEYNTGARGVGRTVNVSAGGVFFRPRFWRDWRPLEAGHKLRVRVDGVRYDGTVVRVERPDEDSNRPGVAVRFDRRPSHEKRRLAV